MDITAVEKDVKEFAYRLGATLVGFASVRDINKHAPPGYRPTDYLEGAKSVVVVAAGGPTAGTWKSHNPRALEMAGYSRTVPPSICFRLSHYIEDKYRHYAILVPPGRATGHIPAAMSLKLLAEMAGLGTRTMAAQIIMNEKYGLLYFGGTITTLPLRPTGPLKESLCPHRLCINMWKKQKTTPCLKACPHCLSGELEVGKIKWAEYNQLKCYSRAQTTGVDFFLKMLTELMEEKDPQQRRFMAYGPHFYRTMMAVSTGEGLVAQCFECTRVCPIGFKHRYGSLH